MFYFSHNRQFHSNVVIIFMLSIIYIGIFLCRIQLVVAVAPNRLHCSRVAVTHVLLTEAYCLQDKKVPKNYEKTSS
jgi:hypothetical protein